MIDVNDLKTAKPIPRSQLIEAANELFNYAVEQAHNLERQEGGYIEHFFAACLRVSTSNILAMIKLGAGFKAEGGAIFRNLIEATVDYFWIASIAETDRGKAVRLSQNFFLYLDHAFLEKHELMSRIAIKDPYLRHLKQPDQLSLIVEEAAQRLGSKCFHKGNWRKEVGFMSDEEVKWKPRCDIAKEFIHKKMNLKGAPYYENLQILSGFSHFSAEQVQLMDDELKNASFDRDLNIALGFTYDMLRYSYNYIGWSVPEPVNLLRFKFYWMST
jgi:hypothetical protein